MRERGTARALTVLFLLVGGMLAAQEENHWVPPRDYSMPKEEVWESFLGYLVGLMNADVLFSVDGHDLAGLFPELKARRGDPFELLREVARQKGEGDQVQLLFSFPGPLQIPLPVGLFGYHPIYVYASQTVALTEERYAVRRIRPGSPDEAVLSPDFEYRIAQGYAQFWFDEWLTALTGGFLDTFSVRGVAIFRTSNTWHALLAGLGQHNQVVCWLFDLKRMRLILSIPKALLDLAADLT